MKQHNSNNLGFWHPSGETYRLLPRHGDPLSIVEWCTQRFIKYLARFPIYCAVVVLLTAIAQLWIVPSL